MPQTLAELRSALLAAERAAVVASGLPEATEQIAVATKALHRARASAARAAEAVSAASVDLAAARAARSATIATLVEQGVDSALVAEAAGVDRSRIAEIVRDRRAGREAGDS